MSFLRNLNFNEKQEHILTFNLSDLHSVHPEYGSCLKHMSNFNYTVPFPYFSLKPETAYVGEVSERGGKKEKPYLSPESN